MGMGKKRMQSREKQALVERGIHQKQVYWSHQMGSTKIWAGVICDTLKIVSKAKMSQSNFIVCAEELFRRFLNKDILNGIRF